MVKCKIPVNRSGKHVEELVFVSHKKKLTIAKYDGDESIEVKTLDVPRIIDALIFIDTQENKFAVWNASGPNKGVQNEKTNNYN